MTTDQDKPNESELLACPFCGGNADLIRNFAGWLTVECNDCGAHGPCIELEASGAVRLWNTRLSAQAKAATEATGDNPSEWRTRVFRAAERANKRFGQWMPQQWVELFIGEMSRLDEMVDR